MTIGWNENGSGLSLFLASPYFFSPLVRHVQCHVLGERKREGEREDDFDAHAAHSSLYLLVTRVQKPVFSSLRCVTGRLTVLAHHDWRCVSPCLVYVCVCMYTYVPTFKNERESESLSPPALCLSLSLTHTCAL